MQRAFDAGIDEVVALIVPGNERSVHVAERLGMQHLGLTDRYYGIKAHLYHAARHRAAVPHAGQPPPVA